MRLFVTLRKCMLFIMYHNVNKTHVYPLSTRLLRLVGRLGTVNRFNTHVGWLLLLQLTVNRFNHTCWMAVVTPTDCPQLVCNRCVIEVFCCVSVLSFSYWIFCWCRGFLHRTESDLVLFLFINTKSGYSKYKGHIWFWRINDGDVWMGKLIHKVDGGHSRK